MLAFIRHLAPGDVKGEIRNKRGVVVSEHVRKTKNRIDTTYMENTFTSFSFMPTVNDYQHKCSALRIIYTSIQSIRVRVLPLLTWTTYSL